MESGLTFAECPVFLAGIADFTFEKNEPNCVTSSPVGLVLEPDFLAVGLAADLEAGAVTDLEAGLLLVWGAVEELATPKSRPLGVPVLAEESENENEFSVFSWESLDSSESMKNEFPSNGLVGIILLRMLIGLKSKKGSLWSSLWRTKTVEKRQESTD